MTAFRATHGIVLCSMGLVVAALIVATITLFVLQFKRPGADFTELKQRIYTWWVMAAVFFSAMLINEYIAIAFFAFISFLALKEFLTMIPTRPADRRVLFWIYLAIPVQYVWIASNWYGMFIIFIPVYLFLFLPLRMVIIGETEGYINAVGVLHWGAMLTIFCISHVAYLLVLPAKPAAPAGGPGLVLFLVILTQGNDVLQYLWGKNFGKTKIIPKVSPNKTWEGFAGGLLSTFVLALVLSRFLTPFTLIDAALAGLLIGAAGFVGDVSVSAIKRDLGLKDTGALLPGHGGILDRIDSLIYTAPLFFHFVWYLYY